MSLICHLELPYNQLCSQTLVKLSKLPIPAAADINKNTCGNDDKENQ